MVGDSYVGGILQESVCDGAARLTGGSNQQNLCSRHHFEKFQGIGPKLGCRGSVLRDVGGSGKKNEEVGGRRGGVQTIYIKDRKKRAEKKREKG